MMEAGSVSKTAGREREGGWDTSCGGDGRGCKPNRTGAHCPTQHDQAHAYHRGEGGHTVQVQLLQRGVGPQRLCQMLRPLITDLVCWGKKGRRSGGGREPGQGWRKGGAKGTLGWGGRTTAGTPVRRPWQRQPTLPFLAGLCQGQGSGNSGGDREHQRCFIRIPPGGGVYLRGRKKVGCQKKMESPEKVAWTQTGRNWEPIFILSRLQNLNHSDNTV